LVLLLSNKNVNAKGDTTQEGEGRAIPE